jgi:hypothetical protein
MIFLRRSLPVLAAVLCACSAQTSTPPASPTSTQPPAAPTTAATAALASPLASPLTSRAHSTTAGDILLPMVQSAPPARRVLFLAGSFLPESGYPHSRVYDSAAHPESFLQLRTQVLEQELGFDVDEIILDANTVISPAMLAPHAVAVLGSNDRSLLPTEIEALAQFVESGGGLLLYADFQYGPNNWSSDNDFLQRFGLEVFPDNFQPATQITDIVPSHPIMNGVRSFATEGSSQFLISAQALADTIVLARCSPLDRLGCALQEPERSRVGPNDVVACTWIRSVGRGRIAGTCDRNTFHDGPGIGTALSEFDNRRYAANLFRWLATGR